MRHVAKDEAYERFVREDVHSGFFWAQPGPGLRDGRRSGGEIAQHCRPYTVQIWNYIVRPSLNVVFTYQAINNIYFSTHCNLTIEFDVTYLIPLTQRTPGLGFTTTMESRGSGFSPYLMVGGTKDRDKLLYKCQTQVEKMVKLHDLYHPCSVPVHERIGGTTGMPHSIRLVCALPGWEDVVQLGNRMGIMVAWEYGLIGERD